MKIDWSKLNKGYIIVWYIITIFVILGMSIFTTLIFAVVVGHMGYLLFIGVSLVEYAIENKM